MLIYRGIKLHPYPHNRAPTIFDEARFRVFLASWNVTLPEDYIAFLRETNGGQIDSKQKVAFECTSPRRSERINYFFPSHPDMQLVGVESIRRLDSEFYPPYIFSIGECYSDKILAIVLSGPLAFACVVVDMKLMVPDTQVSVETFLKAKGVSIAAKSFTSLMNLLEINENYGA